MMFREIKEVRNEEKNLAYTKIGSDKKFSNKDLEEANTFWMQELLKAAKDN